MTRLIFSLFFILFTALARAQSTPQVVYSEPLEDLSERSTKVIQLPNGNTCLVTTHNDDGIRLFIWDAQRKLIFSTPEGSKRANGSAIHGTSYRASVFGIGNDGVLFKHVQRKIVSLGTVQRTIYDGTDGHVKSDTTVVDLDFYRKEYYDGPKVFALSDDDMVKLNPLAVKDEFSSAYGFASNYDPLNGAKNLVLFHYGANHHLLYTRDFEKPDAKLENTRLLDMLVLGDTALVVATMCWNKERNGGARFVYLSRVSARSIEHVRIMPVGQYFNGCILTTDAAHTAYGLLIRNGTGFNRLYAKDARHVAWVDARDMKLLANTRITTPPVRDPVRIKNHRNPAERNFMEPRAIGFLEGTGLTVVMETMDVFPGDYTGDDYYHKGVKTIVYGPDGKLTEGPSVFKANKSDDKPFLYQRQWDVGMITNSTVDVIGYEMNQSSASAGFIRTPAGWYVLFNTRPQIMVDKPEEPLLVNTIRTTQDVGGYLQKIEAGSKSFNLFQVPADGSERKRVDIPATSYDAQTNTIAMLMLEEKRGKPHRLVWVKL